MRQARRCSRKVVGNAFQLSLFLGCGEPGPRHLCCRLQPPSLQTRTISKLHVGAQSGIPPMGLNLGSTPHWRRWVGLLDLLSHGVRSGTRTAMQACLTWQLATIPSTCADRTDGAHHSRSQTGLGRQWHTGDRPLQNCSNTGEPVTEPGLHSPLVFASSISAVGKLNVRPY